MDSNFMTTKEKDYVSYIFTKNTRQLKGDIDYKKVFSGIKQDYTSFKNDIKTSFVFGKDTCRDNKKNRYFTASKNIPQNLQLECEVDNIYTKLICTRYFTNEISISYDPLKYIKTNKLWDLLQLTFESFDDKKNVIVKISKHFEDIEAIDKFTDFINDWYDKIPQVTAFDLDKDFLVNFMTKSLGLVLATCFLIGNNDLYEIFYNNTINNMEVALIHNEIWNFLVVLMNFCNKEQKFELIKSTKERLHEIKCDNEKFDKAKTFLKCLGLEPEDISL